MIERLEKELKEIRKEKEKEIKQHEWKWVYDATIIEDYLEGLIFTIRSEE